MKFKLAIFTSILTFVSSAFASDIYVREARGNLTRSQVAEVTSLVKNAVRNMPEQTLVRRLAEADFVLQPSVITRGDELILRVEKIKNGEVLAMSEETINSLDSSRNRAMAIVETALQNTTYGSPYSMDDDNATYSGSSQSLNDVAANPKSTTTTTKETVVIKHPADNSATYTTTGVDSTAGSPGADASVGELTSASPRMMNPDRLGQIQLGVGPAFPINMKDDSLMYDLIAAYAMDISDNFVGKFFGDFNLGTGSSNTRFINLGLGADYFPTRELLTFGKPYIGPDVGFAFTRDNLGRTGDNFALGLGAGFKFQAAQMNWDVNAHYTILLAQVADETPNVFGVRVALGF